MSDAVYSVTFMLLMMCTMNVNDDDDYDMLAIGVVCCCCCCCCGYYGRKAMMTVMTMEGEVKAVAAKINAACIRGRGVNHKREIFSPAWSFVTVLRPSGTWNQ